MRVRSFLFAFWLFGGSVGADPLERLVIDRHYYEALRQIAHRLPHAPQSQRQYLWLLKAESHVQLQQLDDAEATLKHIPLATAPPAFFRIRGEWNLLKEENSLARQDLEYVLGLAPGGRQEILAACELAKLEANAGHAKEADRFWQLAVQVASKLPGQDAGWNHIYSTKSALLAKQGQREEALAMWRIARSHFEGMNNQRGVRGALLNQAGLLKQMGNFAEAEATWKRCLALSPREAGSVAIAWGYNLLYSRDDANALRRWLKTSEQLASHAWAPYERFHLHFLQGQVCIVGLNEPRRAQLFLQKAEKLASPVPRPAGERMTAQVHFHEFGPTVQSEAQQVAWLQLDCLEKLETEKSAIQAFMESKLRVLPTIEQAPWLLKLAETYLHDQPERSRQLFARALVVGAPGERATLLRATLDAYLASGQLDGARETLIALRDTVSRLSVDLSLQLTRSLVHNSLARQLAWVRPLWAESLDPGGESFHLLLQEELLADPARRAQLEKADAERLEKHARENNQNALSQDYLYQAQKLLAENRLAEAIVNCKRARECSLLAELPSRVAETDRLIAYLQFRLGDREAAVARIDSARNAFARLVKSSAADEEADCAALQIAFHLNMHQADAALALIDRYARRHNRDYRAALEYARARAHLLKNEPARTLEALQRCESRVAGTLYAIPVGVLRARTLYQSGRVPEARTQLAATMQLARDLRSMTQRDVCLVWHEIDPASAPIAATAESIETLLAQAPPSYASKLRVRPSTRKLFALAGRSNVEASVPAGWLTRQQFFTEVNSVLADHPELMTTVAVLPASLAHQAELLPEGQVALEFFVGKRELVIMAASREGFQLRRMSVERDTIEGWVRDMRQQLSGQSATSHAAVGLYRMLIDPVADQVRGKSLLLMSHGPLLALPWDLLRTPEGKLLAQDFEWSLWAGEGLGNTYSATNPHVVAVGGVVGAELPASEREVAELARAFPNNVEALSGANATLALLRPLLAGADVLHIATHSQVEGRPSDSYIQLSDGSLTLDQVYGLPLRRGALVVLSSCNSAAAHNQERGPVTLAGAFLAAGASHVVASLSPVGDEEAEALFKEFYRQLAGGFTPASALRRAKQTRLEAAGEADWASFVLLNGV